MKKIIVLSRRMDIGGVETSLINFLKCFDCEKYEVTLLLQEKKGTLLHSVPDAVKIIEMKFDSVEYLKLVQLDMVLPTLKEMQFKLIAAKCKLEKDKNDNPFLYKALEHCSAELDDCYDLAIDYHGYGYFTTIFMINAIKANKYATFIHDDKFDWMDNIKSIRNDIDYYFCVSKACGEHLVDLYPDLKSKTQVFYNIVDADLIKTKAQEVQNDIPENAENVIVTVGRLEWQKGYDFLLDVAYELKKKIDFSWYIIGDGSWRERIENDIKDKALQDNVFLLGAKENPYPYIKRADVYAQTSRHEGYGLAICEALVLKKTVISTDLPCIEEQIKHGINGFLVRSDVTEFFEQIQEVLINNPFKKGTEKIIRDENRLDNILEAIFVKI